MGPIENLFSCIDIPYECKNKALKLIAVEQLYCLKQQDSGFGNCLKGLQYTA